MTKVREETLNVVQYATLTEQLLQYQIAIVRFDDHVQAAFDEALYIFEKSMTILLHSKSFLKH